MISMADFWTNFLANISADIIIAIAVFIAITRPNEKREAQKRERQALGLLKAEMEANAKRAKSYLETLHGTAADLKTLSPLRYTRGAWNALKEGGFLLQLKDAILVYHLLRVNEAIVVADASLHKVIIAVRDRKGTRSLVQVAIKDNERLLKVFDPLLLILSEKKLPEFLGNDLYDVDQSL
jgi:hypothetical protein